MKYQKVERGTFLERPNRFIAYIELNGKKERVHVKNTGRLTELLRPGTPVYVQEAENAKRKTKWDLIAVQKENRVVNIDSQIPNRIAEEWVRRGHFIDGDKLLRIRSEYTYGNSRIDLYAEAGDGNRVRKLLIEVKGVTLEERGAARFPDAPSERAVKHVEELKRAAAEGFETYILFVIQMEGARYFTPNVDTHPAFGEALKSARKAGVHVIACGCAVEPDEIEISGEVPVVLEAPALYEIREPLVNWYRENKRELPWRENPDAYRVWVSEIMLQQTRVETVKPYYERFMKALPTVKALAEAEEDTLLKLWEGLGYYNRVRNMQKAARQIMVDFHGVFPDTYEEILTLSGVGSYTAGAVSAFAFGIPKPAVDGNVLRVVSRILGSGEDIMKQKVHRDVERQLEEVIPPETAGDFVQGLIELGALVCVPSGEPHCGVCPAAQVCKAHAEGREKELPVKGKAKKRRVETYTVLLFRDGDRAAIRRRPAKGLLAGMYEFPNLKGRLEQDEVIAYSKKIGLTPVKVRDLGEAKHIFSHVEWQMTGYLVVVDELEKDCREDFIFVKPAKVREKYPIPAAFEKYAEFLDIKLGRR